ncbi:cell wall metabolism sensor histidine kinase WalK [Limosilactobacillus fermentum]|uniref:cell wall metabolism sensor histidine kinase WalK n=1 Tax=Limosilactobacillus fermentum TaxID=1613 RepID=UPI00062D33F2|nr:cell wall metabolism sensor histidine kinase WalK [Limosilactobacillus fermentum]AZI17685.1 cell wall metabolism sensor histidine kinase WalK [Limosilactobacillus fermentum]KLD55598.1 histidine kinase [Limosilactobacillus fermentum]MBM9559833.1 cell wall metabolism sensor histidine kinase WalK [Limosilactobacillus fermentum]MCD5423532.1 cell wall metabolism sensor histidine kinase WalK [Limosilactobacillus fermentum]MCT3429304.1 cell wall metabolism sensor histidine kinase WalK [Limosilacto
MNSKIKFYQSIHFKIALVFALMLMLTLEVVGAVFVRQLEHQELANFKQQIELPSYIDNSLATQLTSTDTKTANKEIKTILARVNNTSITEIRVVDAKGIIRGTSSLGNQGIVGQKTTDTVIKNTLVNNRSHTENLYDSANHNRYYVSVVPLLASGNANNVVGVVYMRANLEGVYSTINSISLIYLSAALITIVLGLGLAVLISREITRPIEEMRKQTLRIARGDFSGQVKVMGNDELGQLAGAVNNLSVRVEESQESSDAERRRLDSVLSHMSDGVLATDRRGNLTIVNNTALQFLNIADEEQVLGKSILDVLKIRRQFSIRHLVDEDQDQIILDDLNEDLILSAYFSPIKRESGFVSGLVCVLHDVTSQQKEERERKEFVSNVSHELRTPLTSVKSYVEALSDGAINDPELAPRFLGVVSDETERMIRMINDLLSLSRMDSGTAKLNLEYVNINELFNYILNRFDMIIKNEAADPSQKKYTIVRYFTKKDLWVEIDTDKFTQVVDNIMNNAVKYSPDGGVITARLLETHNHVILSISDQGLGIPRKDLGHIFDRFFRVDKARSRKQGGTGLGLAISKEVVNLLGGQIWVDSVEGKGSTFYISLPYVPYEEEEWDDQAD